MSCDSVDGAKASSLFYSLTVTAKLDENNSFETLAKILNEINSASSIEDYERLAGLLVKRQALH
jgi:hypothetical protein